MPAYSISNAEALANRRNSPFARWPKRGAGENRIEPIASPGFTPTFRFEPGCTIFTIGSCFARNVEAELERQGFVVPTRRFWRGDSTGRSPDDTMLNNYGVPAIYNEIAWALGEEEFNSDKNFAELQPGLFADIHLLGRLPLEPREAVVARRERIFEVTRSVLTADVMIMTLGLAEVWIDTDGGCYLNTFPRETLTKHGTGSDRFALHVLSYGEVEDFLSRTFEIIFRRCRPELRVILSISPVPMASTFTGSDVCVANTYSKSVLRAAAESIVRKSKRIDYFPSYESVVLSDRSLAWEDDQIHVRPELVAHNVNRLVEAYAGRQSRSEPAGEAKRSEEWRPPPKTQR